MRQPKRKGVTVLIQGLGRGDMVSLLMEVLVVGHHPHDFITDTSMFNQSELEGPYLLHQRDGCVLCKV